MLMMVIFVVLAITNSSCYISMLVLWGTHCFNFSSISHQHCAQFMADM